MMEKNLVSIIIPTYKTNDSLKRAIESVLNQTYKNIEIIVVDDNDPTTKYRKIAENIMRDFSFVKYIKHEKNKNGSAARNTGIKAANGKYIGFLDDDDYFFSDKIAAQVELLETTGINGCSCFWKKHKSAIKFKLKSDYTEDILFNKTIPQTSSLLIKKQCLNELNGFDENFIRHQDYEFLLRYFEKNKILVIPTVLYQMDYNDVNNIPNVEKMENVKKFFLNNFEDIIAKRKFNKKRIYAKNFSYIAFMYIKKKDLKNVLRLFKENSKIYMFIYIMEKIFNSILNKFRKAL